MATQQRPLVEIVQAGLFGTAIGLFFLTFATPIESSVSWYILGFLWTLGFGGLFAALAALDYAMCWALKHLTARLRSSSRGRGEVTGDNPVVEPPKPQ